MLSLLQRVLMLVAAQRSTALVLNTLKSASVLNPATGTATPLLDGLATSRNLVVLLPQVGEFDSYEFCEQLTAVADDLKAAGLGLRVVGVADADHAQTQAGSFQVVCDRRELLAELVAIKLADLRQQHDHVARRREAFEERCGCACGRVYRSG